MAIDGGVVDADGGYGVVVIECRPLPETVPLTVQVLLHTTV